MYFLCLEKRKLLNNEVYRPVVKCGADVWMLGVPKTWPHDRTSKLWRTNIILICENVKTGTNPYSWPYPSGVLTSWWFQRVGLITAGQHRTTQDSTGHRRTAQDNCRTAQDTAVHCKILQETKCQILRFRSQNVGFLWTNSYTQSVSFHSPRNRSSADDAWSHW